MLETILIYLQNIPPKLAVMLIAMIPAIEMNGAVPLGMTYFKLSIMDSMLYGWLGNMLLYFLVSLFLYAITPVLMHYIPPFKKLMNMIFMRTRVKHSAKIERLGDVLLLLYLALPTPLSGAFTAAIIVYVFNRPYIRATILVSIGMFIAVLVLSMGTLGVQNVYDMYTLIVK